VAAWGLRATQIPDQTLQHAALHALQTKSEDIEGAIAYAAFACKPTRAQVVRAIASFQIAFDYLDTIVELPNPDRGTNSRSLHRALFAAVSPGTPHSDYYCYHSNHDDGGYLEALVEACQTAISTLPSLAKIRLPIERAVTRITTYQNLSHGDPDGRYAIFTDWARSQAVHGTHMYWWETGAATGSQLLVLALIAAAADPEMHAREALAIEEAYFPWIGALSTLLDDVIDRRIDKAKDERNLIDCYHSLHEASTRLQLITTESIRATQPLATAEKHAMLLAGMAAFFHSRSQTSGPDAELLTRAVVDSVGRWRIPALTLLRARDLLGRPMQAADHALTAPLSHTAIKNKYPGD
jgi:tetraprenyl-beta-curcumene synthase